jgi:uracil-DNA glycosylase family 4
MDIDTSKPDTTTVEPSTTAEQHRKHPLAECERCSLRETGVFVPTLFPAPSPDGQPPVYAVVGEAPGVQEAHRGRPFTGPSGKLLNRVLEHHDINREELILTNAILCRPPDNNLKPHKDAIGCCKKRLASDLAGVQKALALGGTAAQVLLGTTQGITSLRIGPPKPSQLVDGLEVVPSFHPAYCLRSGDHFPSLVNDTYKLLHNIEGWEPPEYVVATEVEQAVGYLEQLLERTELEELVVDIETGIDKEESYDHPNHYQMLCVGICYAKGKAVIIGEEPLKDKGVLNLLKRLLQSRKLIEHNGKFDNGGLYPLLGDLRIWFDTMLANYCLDERPGHHGLKENATERLGAPDYEKEIQKYLGVGKKKNYATIPRPLLYKYNAYDVAVTWDLKEYYEPELERLGLRQLHDFLVAAANELKFPELNGVKIDLDYNRQLTEEYIQELADLERQLDATLPEGEEYDKRGGINPRSPQQVMKYFHAREIRVKDTTADTLEALLENKDRLRLGEKPGVVEFLTLMLTIRKKVKEYGTYVKGITSRLYRGRVYTTYSLHGTTSGRTASRNPNLQNIIRAKRIKRQFIVSKPGNVWVGADYKQAEGRVICTLSRDEYLAGIFRDPEADLFTSLGRDLYGRTDKLSADERVRVKAYFYGLGYGREAYSIAQEWGMSVREAEEGLRDFMGLIPNVRAWQLAVQNQVLRGEDLVTTFGRHRRFALITRENRKDVLKEALSFLPQSTASDICLSALIRLRPMLRGRAWLRLTIHDALYFECAREDASEVGRIIREVMVEEGAKWTDYVPFAVDLSIGENWADMEDLILPEGITA